ncbi:type I restriction enzyme, S subunit [Vibrio crassostreae]|nr:type I restriction enzyme, S subunit [Vibrio crassostreae]CAK2838841.1 type I restriction enzyme, S subunit [Vibrio crassostreae]CAK2866782.1 type I restriction enzyme, S subunit [Vibrio crassostreae]
MDKTLGLACNISTGKLDANQAVSGGEYPFFTCAEFPDQIDHFAYDDDVVLVAGNNARGNFHVSRYKGKFNAYQRTYILTAKEGFNIDYIYYALKLELKRLREKSQGSQTKFLTMPILTGIHLSDVTGDEQTEIASVLSTIDKKIELNNRINAELEAMAKTLYDYWFVQFDFPDANGKPYKASSGKMVYNDTLKREIPEGWSASNILSVANLLGGGTPSKSKEEYWNGHIPFFTPSDSDNNVFSIETESYITDLGLEKSSTRLFEKNTVFITARGSVGRLALNSVPMAMNQSCYALKPKNGISFSFLFYLTKELIHHLEVKASGSVFNSIVSNDIEFTNLALPDDKTIIERFAEMAEPIFKHIEIATLENKQLSSQRDWLLLMLMNGQVTVKPKTESQEAQHG